MNAISDTLATKADIAELKAVTKADISEMKTELLRWMFAQTFVIIGMGIALKVLG